MVEEILISVIIPTKDRKELLVANLARLIPELNGISHEIILVNDDKKNTFSIPSGPYTIVNNPNSGVASARNYGVTIATGVWLLFLDDDMLVMPGNLECYLKHTGHTENFCVNVDWTYPPEITKSILNSAFGRFLVKFGFTTLQGWNRGLDWRVGSVFEGTGITSQNLFIRKELFLRSGGYPRDMPHAGFEDHIFSKRLKAMGVKFLIDTTSCMYHNEVDRLEPKEWFKRKERGGYTRGMAVQMGYTELQIKHSFFKVSYYAFSVFTTIFLNCMLFISARFKTLDALSFQCYKALLGIAIHKGYRSSYKGKKLLQK